jgi:hypothetical protein
LAGTMSPARSQSGPRRMAPGRRRESADGDGQASLCLPAAASLASQARLRGAGSQPWRAACAVLTASGPRQPGRAGPRDCSDDPLLRAALPSEEGRRLSLRAQRKHGPSLTLPQRNHGQSIRRWLPLRAPDATHTHTHSHLDTLPLWLQMRPSAPSRATEGTLSPAAPSPTLSPKGPSLLSDPLSEGTLSPLRPSLRRPPLPSPTLSPPLSRDSSAASSARGSLTPYRPPGPGPASGARTGLRATQPPEPAR